MMKRFAIFAAALALCAADSKSSGDMKFLREVESYMNSMSSIKGSFMQKSSNGVEDSGSFIISRPGRMRLEYKSPMLLVADGESLVYFDKKLDQISYIALDSNPASVILKGTVSLTGKDPNINIKGVEDKGSTTELSLSLGNERQTGMITFVFVNRPLSLAGWRVRDAQGITTDVSLADIVPAENLDPSLFKISRGSVGRKKSGSKYY
jgi:outer membrane lipoprotein-sorting protein